MSIASLLLALPAFAADTVFPNRLVRIIVPLAPGGGTDNLTRIMAPRLTESLGQQVVVENRPGAGGQIGSEWVARAAPDGHTLLNVESSFASNPSLFRKLPYDTLKDFAPVSLLATTPNVLMVHPSVPAKSLKELVALGKAKPQLFTFAMGGLGTATHLGIEQFRAATKIDLVVVPYKSGGLATADVLAGQVTMLFGGTSSASGFARAGRLRAIAVTGEKRNASLPDTPTFAELGMKEVDSQSYFGSVAPAAVPRDSINILNGAMRKVLQMPEVRRLLGERGYDIIGSTPEQYAENIRSEMAKWENVVKTTNMSRLN
ncbi:MAG TPA: tripartite tricarboxylate transporter substrate binding protein [Burkholderiales bacterium]|nr:tripartite tricarboxylate transporter substrate binding protein [Burkholderiales bacterium]